MRKDVARNREAILRAVAQQYREHGAVPGMHEVAESAGVGVGTLYRHFPSRESLLEGFAVERLSELVRIVEEADHERDAHEALARLFLEVGRVGCDPALERFVTEDTGAGEVLRGFRAGLGGLLARAQQAGAAAADVTIDDVVALLHAYLAALDRTPPGTQTVERFTRFFLAAIAA